MEFGLGMCETMVAGFVGEGTGVYVYVVVVLVTVTVLVVVYKEEGATITLVQWQRTGITKTHASRKHHSRFQ